MSRCGCGTECSCEITPGCGTTVTGSGQPGEDPYIVSLDASTAAGDGLKAQGDDGCKLATKLVPGGGIEYNPNGAMYTTEAAENVDPTTPTVGGLTQNRAQNQDIVGANLGGYLYKPQSSRISIRNAAERTYDLLHLPVRMLADGTPAITPDEYLGLQNGDVMDFGQLTPVQGQDLSRWRALYNDIGVVDPRFGSNGTPDPTDPLEGWFGYLERDEVGLVTLAEAIDIADQRVPLLLEIMWPAIKPGDNGDPTWEPGHEPSPGRVDAFIRHLKRLVRTNRAQNTILVTAWPMIPSPNGPRTVLDELAPAHGGIVVNNEADTARMPANTLQPPSGDNATASRWVMANKNIPAPTLKTYADAGHNVLMYPVTRHAEYDQMIPAAGAVGSLSGDPEYTAGNLDSHPHYSGYPYRKNASTFHHSTITHGLIAGVEDWWTHVHPFQRGLYAKYVPPVDPDHRGEYIIGKENEKQAEGKHWVLQGEFGPVPEPTSWNLDYWVNIYRDYTSGRRMVAAETLICRNTDTPYRSFPESKDKSGYVLSYRSFPGDVQEFAVICWDPAAKAQVVLWKADISAFTSWVAVRAEIRPKGLKVWMIDRASGKPVAGVPHCDTAADPDANKKRLGSGDSGNRGGYIQFGRVVDGGPPGAPEDPESAAFARVLAVPMPPDGSNDQPPPPEGEQPPPPPPEPAPAPAPKPPPPEPAPAPKPPPPAP